INDTYGHDAGDAILRQLATRLRHNTRSIDLVCRTGGEGVVIVIPGSDPEGALPAGGRLRARIAARPVQTPRGTLLQATASIGVASLDEANGALQVLFKRADQALHVAKRGGRNRVVADAA